MILNFGKLERREQLKNMINIRIVFVTKGTKESYKKIKINYD